MYRRRTRSDSDLSPARTFPMVIKVERLAVYQQAAENAETTLKIKANEGEKYPTQDGTPAIVSKGYVFIELHPGKKGLYPFWTELKKLGTDM